jgi:aquaporin Z
MTNTQRGLAEFLGTFWLVFGGCGSAVIAAGFPNVGIGLAGVSLAFGLTVLTMAYSIGHISGCHLNPAVTFGLWAGGRFSGKDIPLYVIAQVLGAIVAAYLLCMIAWSAPGFTMGPTSLAVNGFDALSPGHYSMMAGAIIEVVLTFFFVLVIMGSTDSRAPAGFAPIAIGLGLTLIHLISIPVTNTSVNPARSTGPALILAMHGHAEAATQLWLFWIAPIVGGMLGGIAYKALGADAKAKPPIEGEAI